jgi:iron complex transport system permease protein
VSREITAGIALVGLLIASVLASVALGAVPIPLGEVFQALGGEGDPASRQIVVALRLPRGLLAVVVGGGLAMAGATFQALLRNPLAEPYILGISGGAAVGAVLVLTLGITTQGSWTLPLAAFAGALLAIVLVFAVARRADRSMDVRVLLLAGVVVGAFFSAVIALILAVSDASSVRSAVIWMMGSLAGADWTRVSVVTTYTLPAALLLLGLSRALNLLALGEETASVLGANVERVKIASFVVASLLTAVGVGVAGVIGFVGLVVPHGVRLLVGSDNRILLPLSFLAGGTFLAWADLAARTLVAPAELPIGVITAFVGVPLFLVLLRRSL